MKTTWTEGLSPEDAKRTKEDYVKSAALRNRLVTMLNKRADAEMSASLAKKGYDSPNWSLLQADLVGYQRCIKEIINLITD